MLKEVRCNISNELTLAWNSQYVDYFPPLLCHFLLALTLNFLHILVLTLTKDEIFHLLLLIWIFFLFTQHLNSVWPAPFLLYPSQVLLTSLEAPHYWDLANIYATSNSVDILVIQQIFTDHLLCSKIHMLHRCYKDEQDMAHLLWKFTHA